MATTQQANPQPAMKTDDITFTRTLDAPVNRVFEAWTKPDAFRQWWGPKDFTAPSAKIDARKGGRIISCMRSADGKEFWSNSMYQELVPNQRIVLKDHFADPNGNLVSPSHYGMNNWPEETTITVTFADEGGKTKLMVRHSGIESAPLKDREDCCKGWSETIDKLARFVEKDGNRRS